MGVSVVLGHPLPIAAAPSGGGQRGTVGRNNLLRLGEGKPPESWSPSLPGAEDEPDPHSSLGTVPTATCVCQDRESGSPAQPRAPTQAATGPSFMAP